MSNIRRQKLPVCQDQLPYMCRLGDFSSLVGEGPGEGYLKKERRLMFYYSRDDD